MESDSVALEPVSSTQLKLALSAISAKKKEKILIKAFKLVTRKAVKRNIYVRDIYWSNKNTCNE